MRKQSVLHSITLLMIFLVITLPISIAQPLNPQSSLFYQTISAETTHQTVFGKITKLNTNSQITKQKQQKTALFQTTGNILNVVLPKYHNKKSILIKGETNPSSQVNVYFGPDKTLSGIVTRESTSAGSFEYTLSPLDEGENIITLSSLDQESNEIEEQFTVIVDTIPPKYIISEIPRLTPDETITINGSVDENVVITFEVASGVAVLPANIPKVTGLTAENIEANSFTLRWNETSFPTFNKYVIYRDGKRIATNIRTPRFIEAGLNSNTTYSYQVSALDSQCREGELSDPLEVTTLEGAENELETTEIPLCEPTQTVPLKTITTSTNFQETLTLSRGLNKIKITITDLANNSVIIENTTSLEKDPPEIESTNLDRLSPSYVRDVHIKGKVSKKAKVYAFINDERTRSGITAEPEERWSDIADTESDFSTQTDDNRTFSLEIELRRDPDFAYTSEGARYDESMIGVASPSYWVNKITLVAIDEVGLESQAITEDIEYSLCGEGGDWVIDIKEVTPDILIPRLILQGYAQIGFSTDFEWSGPGDDDNAVISGVRLTDRPLSAKEADDYDEEWVDNRIVPSLDSAGNPRSGYFLLNIRAPGRRSINSTLEAENNISDHRLKPESECRLNPVMGCLKIPLMLELRYAYPDPYATPSPSSYSDETYRDVRYRDEQLKSHISNIQRQCWDIEISIDRRLPSDKIPKSFLESSVKTLESAIDAIDSVLKPVNTAKKWVFIGCLGSWVAWWFKRATEWSSCVGVSPKTCNPISTDSNNKCADCLKARAETLKFWEKSQWLCDRIMCPAAPTVQKYMRDARKNKAEYASHCQGETNITWEAKRGDETWDEYWDPENYLIEPRPVGGDVPGHPNEKYCEYEYIKEYDSVAVALNEFKESRCLTKEGKDLPECGGLKVFPRLLRGVCTGQNKGKIVIATSLPGQKDTSYYIIDTDPESGDDSIKAAWEGEFYAEIKCEDTDDPTICTTGESLANYIKKKSETPVLRVRGNAKYKCVEGTGDSERYISYEERIKDGTFAKDIPISVYEHVCAEAKDYVIDPTADLISAFQSLCLTAISEYLQHYRTILMMVKNCFNTILHTGDGSAGICKQVLSIYICDLIYFAIKCIIEKAGKGYGGERVGGGITGFIRYISDSGAKTQNKIRSRYGTSGIYRALFVERKLLHATCRFAFTGDWDFDIEGLVEQEVQVPIATTCFLTGTRRFQTKDPSVGGRATFLYHLGVFIVSGAEDLIYRVELRCSGDNTCDSDIDPNGMCDCLRFGDGQQVANIKAGPGRLNQGETVNEEIFREEKRPYRYDKAKIFITYKDNQGRTVEEECASVNLWNIGSPPPVDCKFDTAVGEYHCAYDFGRHGYAYFDLEEIPLDYHNKDGLYLGLGEKIELKGSIVKKSKSDQTPETMYLVYSLYYQEDSSRKLIPQRAIPLTADGTLNFRDKIPPVSPFPGIRITERAGQLADNEINPFEGITSPRSIPTPASEDRVIVEFSPNNLNFIPFGITIAKSNGEYTINPRYPCKFSNGNQTWKGSKDEFAYGVSCAINSTTGEPIQITLRGYLINNTVDLSLQPSVEHPGGTQKNLVLEMSLHYEYDKEEASSRLYDPVPIVYNGLRQERFIPFTIRKVKPTYTTAEGRQRFDCGNNVLLEQPCRCGSTYECGGASNQFCCNSENPYCKDTECDSTAPTANKFSLIYQNQEVSGDKVEVNSGQEVIFTANITDTEPGIWKAEIKLGNYEYDYSQRWSSPFPKETTYISGIIDTSRYNQGGYPVTLRITDGDGNPKEIQTGKSINIMSLI